MRVLVTGAAGFLGSHLCDALLARDHEVVGVDNYFTGSKTNVSHLRDDPNFEMIRHDVTFPLYVEVDAILNFACPASPKWYQKDPVQTLKTSVHGTINMLGLAKRTGARFVQASTSEVYGDPVISPQPESYWGNVNPIGPRSCYDEGKRAAETLCHDYQVQHGLDTRILRIFNTYGPRMGLDDGRVVSNFIAQALRGDPLTIYGDGQQTRSFCYVSDLVEGIVRTLTAPETPPSPMNIGNPVEDTIEQIAHAVIRLTGSSSPLVRESLPQDDPRQRKPDISRIQASLGWQPEVDLNEGLTRTIEDFRERIQVG